MQRSIFPRALALTVALVLIITPATVIAGKVSAGVNYPPPSINQIDGFHRITLPKALNIGDPGTPSLPSDGVWLILPPGERAVSVELKSQVWNSLPGSYIPEPTQEPKRLSDRSPSAPTPPDPSIYGGKNVYPAETVTDLVTQLKRGYALATCLVFPVRWDPENRSLEYLSEAEVVIETAPGQMEQSGYNRFFRGDRETHDWVADKVRNHQILGLYPRRDDELPESVLIVTDRHLVDSADEYADWWSTRGRRTYVVTVDDLIEAEEGENDQERVRNGIIRAYEDSEISYVIILGDTEQVPHRGLWGQVGQTVDEDIPADLYYACLDGNWNSDNDRRYGEAGEEDLLAEVIVGRVPGAFNNEVRRHINKVMLYSDEPVVDDILKALMLGEYLDWNIGGGEYMDEIYEGSDRYGHNTAGFPDRFNRRNLYDRNGTWNGVRDLAPLLSDGYHLVNHLGHAFTNMVMKLTVNQVTENIIRNDGRDRGFNIAYSQGCYAGAFDNRGESPGQYFDFDCIAERHVSGIANGFVAFLCNSRYGWGNYDNTNGTSQHFQREFVDALFGEDITIIGRTNQDSKEDLSAWVRNNLGIRWCYYQVNLFGDPLMDIWTDEPEELDLGNTPPIVLGSDEYEVTVNGVEGAVVCLSDEGEILSAGLTDEDGHVLLEFDEPINQAGFITLAVTAHNYLPYYDEIQTICSEHGYPWVEELLVDDDEGNSNGQIDAGETVVLNPVVRNMGVEALEGLTITLTTEDRMVRLVSATAAYPLIEAEDHRFADEPIVLYVVPWCSDMHVVDAILEAQDVEGRDWSQEMSIVIHAPAFTDHTLEILEVNGNDNGNLDPGEDISLRLSVTNSGSCDAENLTAVLECENEMIEVVDNEGELRSLGSGESGIFHEAFRIRIDEDCPNPYRAVLYVRISGDMNLHRTWLKDIGIGGEYYTFERGEYNWDHYDMGDEWGDEFHFSDQDNFTPGGSHCLKLGPADNDDNYDNDLNCAIEMPEFHIGGPMQLTFQHKIHAECYADEPDSAFDGGFLEISVNGGQWLLILPQTPEGEGYPYVVREGQTANPIDETPCYSGEHDWTPAVFDLTEFEGNDVIVRFRFGSDGSVSRRGWWIDDIELRLPTMPDALTDLSGEIRETGAYLYWTTPIPRRDDGSIPNVLLGYRIYRQYGPIEDPIDQFLDTLVTINHYLDNLEGMPSDAYHYQAYAVYTTGQSDASNWVSLEWTNDVREQVEEIPTEWALTGVYPNPFNSLAKIGYSVPEPGDIRLSVYDLHGREVALLAQGQRQPGRYQTVLNAENMASGIYIVRLQTPAGAKVSRMVLIR